jgi:hypothetical protein
MNSTARAPVAFAVDLKNSRSLPTNTSFNRALFLKVTFGLDKMNVPSRILPIPYFKNDDAHVPQRRLIFRFLKN